MVYTINPDLNPDLLRFNVKVVIVMANRDSEEREVRKLGKSGDSTNVTLPIELIRNLGWKMRQKVKVKQFGKKRIVIEDWEK